MNLNGIQGQGLSQLLPALRLRRGLVFGVIIFTALLAFEIFNYSTTDFALSDLLGELKFAGIRWSTILSIAFCGIDFAGIARLFTPEEGQQEPTEVWYLFGAWMLAAAMNAMLTWWGVSLAVLGHNTLGNEVIARESLLKIVPVFVAILVWLIRVLIIGTFSVAGERLFSQSDQRVPARPASRGYNLPSTAPTATRSLGSRTVAPAPMARASAAAPAYRPAPKAPSKPVERESVQEPTYHPVAAASNAAPERTNMVGYNGATTRSFASRNSNRPPTKQ